jgi:hypothetical protein
MWYSDGHEVRCLAMTRSRYHTEPMFSKREAFASGDWTYQARMMDAMTTALERALIGFT